MSDQKPFYDTYRQRVNYWQLFDNSGETPLLLDKHGKLVEEAVPPATVGEKQVAAHPVIGRMIRTLLFSTHYLGSTRSVYGW